MIELPLEQTVMSGAAGPPVPESLASRSDDPLTRPVAARFPRLGGTFFRDIGADHAERSPGARGGARRSPRPCRLTVGRGAWPEHQHRPSGRPNDLVRDAAQYGPTEAAGTVRGQRGEVDVFLLQDTQDRPRDP